MNIIKWIKKARMKDWTELIKNLIPHAAIIISGMLIVFFVIDRINKPMGFMSNEFHKRLTFTLSLLCIMLSCGRISQIRAQKRAAYQRRLREYEARFKKN